MFDEKKSLTPSPFFLSLSNSPHPPLLLPRSHGWTSTSWLSIPPCWPLCNSPSLSPPQSPSSNTSHHAFTTSDMQSFLKTCFFFSFFWADKLRLWPNTLKPSVEMDDLRHPGFHFGDVFWNQRVFITHARCGLRNLFQCQNVHSSSSSTSSTITHSSYWQWFRVRSSSSSGGGGSGRNFQPPLPKHRRREMFSFFNNLI